MGTPPKMARTLWVDVTELFHHFALGEYPTGVSRVVMSLADGLAADPGRFARVVPFFWHTSRKRPVACTPAMLPLSVFLPGLRAAYRRTGHRVEVPRTRLSKGVVTSLPRSLRHRLWPSFDGILTFVSFAEVEGHRLEEIAFNPGDCVFLPGSFWFGRYLVSLIAQAEAGGAHLAALIHDVLSLSHPDWLGRKHGRVFRAGLRSLLPRCRVIACNSDFTRSELRRCIALPGNVPIGVCRLADAPRPAREQALPPEIADLGNRPYVMFVSTLGARKNHALLVEAWIRLFERYGEATPYLVLVGGGTPSPALADLTARAQARGNRVVRLTGIADGALESLYRHAWLTTYPSLAEGYGLPIAEALARGKVCLASQTSGMAEVAPGLVDPIDPDDPQSVVTAIAAYLDNPRRVLEREAEIRARYRPTD
jgi:glycosyltransferase involved in cell wall biosynthesis